MRRYESTRKHTTTAIIIINLVNSDTRSQQHEAQRQSYLHAPMAYFIYYSSKMLVFVII